MYAEVAWVLVSSGTQVQLQIIFNPDYLPDYLSVSYGYRFVIHITKMVPLLQINLPCLVLSLKDDN